MSEDQSLLRTTLLGSLLDVARATTARAGAGDVAAVRGRRRLPRGRTTSCRASAASLPTSTTHLGRAADRPRARRRPGATPSRPRGRLLRRQGRARRGCSTRCACAWTRRAAPSEPFLHPGRAARGRCRRRRHVGWLGELHPLVAAVGPRASRRRLRARPRRVLAARRRRAACYEDLTSFPEVREDLAVDRPDGRAPRPSVLAVVRERRRRRCCAAAERVRRLPRRAGRRRATCRSRCGSTFRAADRTLTDEEVAPQREQIVAALAEQLGASSVPERRRRSAPPATPARCRARSSPPPALRARGVTARSDVGRAARRPLPAPPRAARCSRSSTSTATPRSTPRSSPTRTAPPRRGRRAARARRPGRRPERRLPAARPAASTRSGTASTPRPSCSARPSTGCPSCYREQIARRRRSSPTPAATRPPRCSALAPLARAGLIGDVVDRRQVRASRAPGRAATDKTHFVTVDENVNAYRVPRHRHTPEIEQELAALGADVRDHVHRRTCCRSTRASWCRAT